MRLKLGSRGSPLALWQARHVAARLAARWPGLEVPLTIIKTEGDQRIDVPLTASGGKGVFVKEIEDALLDGTIDLAVHSLKDLPTDTPDGLALAAIPSRHDARDALVAKGIARVADLPQGALVATGSPRRQCQLLHVRPDLRFTLVRGNVDTRLRKLERGEFDALILAVAGIERLGLTDAPYAPIPLDLCLSAPGQGALALETRADDTHARRWVEALNDPATAAAVAAERAFLAALGAGCLAPAAAHARVEGDALAMDAMIGHPNGRELRRDSIAGSAAEASALGAAIASRLLRAGGDSILREARQAGAEGGA